MKFIYTPAGAPRQEWDFDPNRILNAEAEAIERKTGLPYGKWTEALSNGSVTALHGLLWVLLRRQMPALRYEDVTFSLDEVDVGVDEDDARVILAALNDRIAGGDELSPSEQLVYDRLSAQMADDAPADDEDGADPKA